MRILFRVAACACVRITNGIYVYGNQCKHVNIASTRDLSVNSRNNKMRLHSVDVVVASGARVISNTQHKQRYSLDTADIDALRKAPNNARHAFHAIHGSRCSRCSVQSNSESTTSAALHLISFVACVVRRRYAFVECGRALFCNAQVNRITAVPR